MMFFKYQSEFPPSSFGPDLYCQNIDFKSPLLNRYLVTDTLRVHPGGLCFIQVGFSLPTDHFCLHFTSCKKKYGVLSQWERALVIFEGTGGSHKG